MIPAFAILASLKHVLARISYPTVNKPSHIKHLLDSKASGATLSKKNSDDKNIIPEL